MLDRLDETIVAISSAPGHGVVGIVRLSGARAIVIADQMANVARVFNPCLAALENRCPTNVRLIDQPGSTRVSGEVLIDRDLSLPAIFYVFRAPHSYTRQDLIEIHTTGSPAALELVRGRALDLGAIAAGPGEFTARAFLNGAMDLTEAAGVAGVIRAQSDTQLRASRRILEGALSRAINEARDPLMELLALVEADIDFAEEPIEFITPPALRDQLAEIGERLRRLLKNATPAEQLDVLPHILLFGPPNAGKSSLMNRLSGTSRAICAAAAGTTRDILSAPITLAGPGAPGPVAPEAILLDTAGVGCATDSPVCHLTDWKVGPTCSCDELLALARDMTLSAVEKVDLVCLVVDVAEPLDEHVRELLVSLEVAGVVVAANKCDLISAGEAESLSERMRRWHLGPVCAVSALRGTGIDTLRSALAESLSNAQTTTHAQALLLTQRQRKGILDAREAVDRAIALSSQATETIDCADVLAFELRDAVDALGTIAGAVTTEDLLTHVFANFCIGK